MTLLINSSIVLPPEQRTERDRGDLFTPARYSRTDCSTV
jgi:hypothetical protein